ncbi:MAG: Ig-like domain-containing protein, partial [Kiritimatiellales bacterium]
QGRILLMIENYRTGSTWNRMKTSPIIQRGLAQAGFFVPSTPALPPPWTKADIGVANHLSGNSFYSNGVYTVTGPGTINLKDSDSFNYCYQPASGNCTIQARVTSIGDTNTSSSARAGVMIRETLATNSTHASMLFMPTTNGGGFYTRTLTGGNNNNQKVTGAPALPYWVKVTRSTNNFSGFVSADGTNWTQVGTTKTINMTSNVYIGLINSSSQDSVPCKTRFTNVTVSSGVANSAPVANNQSVTLPENTATNLVLTASDVDNTNLTYSILASPVHGALSGLNTNSGAVTYTPTNNYNGSDSFTFRAFDGSLYATGTVGLTVTYVDVYYALTVTSGTGGGSYTNGRQVAISANAPATGKAFSQWTGDTEYVNNVTYTNALVTMSTNAVSLTATYKDITCALTGNGSTGGWVSPASTNVVYGGSANFVITASNYYRIATLTTNGTVGTGMTFGNNSTTTNFIWSNVQTSGVLAATFTAQVTTNAPAQVPYKWLAQYGLTNYNTDAATDQDQDGLTAWQEYIAGTDPTNAAACFKAAQTNRNVITWTPVTGRIYSVYWSTNLMKGFTNLNNNILYPTNNYTNATPDSRVNHYQIKVRLE